MLDIVDTSSTLSPLQQTLQQAETSCIKCGFCLPACPTYRLTGNEVASPRGRIDLMQALAAGDVNTREIFAALDVCLGCRACETACPAGVQFGQLLEAGRAAARSGRPESPLGDWLQQLCMDTLLPSPPALHRVANLLRLYQVSGLQTLVRRSGVLPRLLPTLAAMEALIPPVPTAAVRRPVPAETPPHGEERGRVAMLTGCIMPELFPEVNHATVYVLAANGYRVFVPPAQRCCGALQAHAGERERAQELARQSIAVFEAITADWIVVNSAGCGAMLKEYGHLLADDPAFAARAQTFSRRVQDVSELLAAAPLRGTLQPVPMRAVYDDPCHLLHGQKIRQQPRAVLHQVPELQLVDLPESDWCCGSAGTYNLLHPKTAQSLLDRKMAHITAVQPQLIITGNPGCILQLRQGVTCHQLTAEVRHPVEVLARAYGLQTQ